MLKCIVHVRQLHAAMKKMTFVFRSYLSLVSFHFSEMCFLTSPEMAGDDS